MQHPDLTVPNRTQRVSAGLYLVIAGAGVVATLGSLPSVSRTAFYGLVTLVLLALAARATRARIEIDNGILLSVSDQRKKRVPLDEVRRFDHKGLRASRMRPRAWGLGAELKDGSWVKLQSYSPLWRHDAERDSLMLNEYLARSRGDSGT
jgi:hypothetical protein